MSVPEPHRAVGGGDLRRSLGLIVMAGCLAMVYTAGVSCPAATDFLKAVGAKEIHFGLLGGIPMIMFTMQFVSAYAANHIRRRKWYFIIMQVIARSLHLSVVVIPLMFSRRWPEGALTAVVVALAVNSALANAATPLWYSWVADLVPGRLLNRYWGGYQQMLHGTWVLMYGLIAVFVYVARLPIKVTFPILAVVGVVAGVTDILLHIGVSEPEHSAAKGRGFAGILLEPLRHAHFRTFVLFSCFRVTGIMFGAAFMQIYALKELNMSVSSATVAWCASGLGLAVSARLWGRIADRFGHRPVMIICTSMKPFIALVYMLVTPRYAFPVLTIAFLIDGMWNAGDVVASNGFMLNMSPKENKSMFVAAIAGLSGIFGGAATIAGGWFLHLLSDVRFSAAGLEWSNYRLLFLVSMIMRIASAAIVYRVREPESSGPAEVLNQIRAWWPFRVLLLPVGWYRRYTGE